MSDGELSCNNNFTNVALAKLINLETLSCHKENLVNLSFDSLINLKKLWVHRKKDISRKLRKKLKFNNVYIYHW